LHVPHTRRPVIVARSMGTVHEQGEYVYASRGLALVLSFDRSTVMELIVFPATTVDDYVRRLRFSEPPREISD
jgi:hypothetical protein